MKIGIFVFLLSFVASVAQASWTLFPVGTLSRFERGDLQEWEARSGFTMAARFDQGFEWGLEWIHFDQFQGTSYSGIERRHNEVLLWKPWTFVFSPNLASQVSAGFGFQQEEIRTHLNGEKSVDRGPFEALGGISLGGLLSVKKTLQLSLEGRLFWSPNFSPNPQPDLVIRAGLKF